MDDRELIKAIRELFREIALKEKEKAIASGDYGTAFVAAIIQGMMTGDDDSSGNVVIS